MDVLLAKVLEHVEVRQIMKREKNLGIDDRMKIGIRFLFIFSSPDIPNPVKMSVGLSPMNTIPTWEQNNISGSD